MKDLENAQGLTKEKGRKRLKKKNKKGKAVLFAVGGIVLAVAGFAIIPPMIEKYGNKIYKASSKVDEIDFDNVGPEIIPKKSKKGEE